MKVKYYTIIILLSTCTSVVKAQLGRDSVMLMERSIDRSITLHRGQLRMEFGYGLSAVSRRFDEDGNNIKLVDEGYSFVRHTWVADFRYGILDNLTLQVATNYKKQSQRHRTAFISETSGDLIRLFEIRDKKGIEDLLVTISARAPFTSKKLDIVATGGVFLPLGNDQATRPEHAVIQGEGFKDVNYHYSTGWGSNVLTATMGGLVKYRFPKNAVTLSAMYDYPLGESKEKVWFHQVTNDQFEYQSESTRYQLPGVLNYSFEFERQLAPWIDLSLLVKGMNSSGGWNEINQAKVTRAPMAYYSFNPGYEILVTHKLWLRQRFSFGLFGKDAEAPFTFHTAVVYNFFPF